MRYYAAPLEGITGYIYRNVHHQFYPGLDKYYIPFLTPKIKRGFNGKEQKEILPAHNEGLNVIPQILTNKAEDFVRVAELLGDYGYREINLNLGCPSGTVVSKGKGCGFLKDHDRLRSFFEEVMNGLEERGLSSLEISVKTRLGLEDPEEILDLMEIYNDYPLSELILHARLYRDFYKGPVRWEAFAGAAGKSRHPICYNGDIFNRQDMIQLKQEFPDLDRVMLGRGLIGNPQLAEQCRLGEGIREETDYERFFLFHDELLARYGEVLSGEKNVLFKMKELWSYMCGLFPDKEKVWKKIKKSKSMMEYKLAVSALSY